MELPHLGTHCSKNDCKKLDFLPIRCDACKNTFCSEHYSYFGHNCTKSYEKDNQVPACPLCNNPVPVGRGQLPDAVVGAHIDNDCQADPAKSRRKVFTNKCSKNRCKTKEVIPVVCGECTQNFCLKHRHPSDHECQGRPVRKNHWIMDSMQAISQKIHGNMSEDEALAQALARSMQDSKPVSSKQQEDLDLALARQLQAQEQAAGGPSRTNQQSKCNVS